MSLEQPQDLECNLREDNIKKTERNSTSEDTTKYKSVLWNVSIFVLFTELCERVAFYGFTGTLIEFLLFLGNDSTFASQMVSLFSALVYISPLIGGYIADELLNRYRTILLFGLVYVIGLSLAVVSADPTLAGPGLDQTTVLLVGLLGFVALGAGGIKANVVTFGADQFDVNDPLQKKEQTRFFNYFYWVVNIGALIATGYISNLSFNPVVFSGGVVPANMGYFVSYTIPLVALIFALIIYVVGTPRYKIKPPSDKAFTGFAKTFADVCWNTSIHGKAVLIAICTMLLSIVLTIISYFVNAVTGETLAYISMSLIFIVAIVLMLLCRNVRWCESYLIKDNDQSDGKIKSRVCSYTTLTNVEDVLLLLPYFCILIIFWIAYIQMSTNFQLQGCQMDMNVAGVVFSPAFFQIFDSLAIIIAIPLVDAYLYPFVERKKGGPIRALDKMCFGLMISCLAMMLAGFLELGRKNAPDLAVSEGYLDGVESCCAGCLWGNDSDDLKCSSDSFCNGINATRTINGVQIIVDAYKTCEFNSYCVASTTKPMKDLSIFYQIIPYIFVGLGEVFTAVPAYDLFYNQVGPEIRSVAQSINLLTTSMGAFAAGGFVTMFQTWLPSNLNSTQAHIEYIFFIVAALCFVASLVCIWLKRSYVYREDRIYIMSVSSESQANIKSSSTSNLNSNSSDVESISPVEQQPTGLHSTSSFPVAKV